MGSDYAGYSFFIYATQVVYELTASQRITQG